MSRSRCVGPLKTLSHTFREILDLLPPRTPRWPPNHACRCPRQEKARVLHLLLPPCCTFPGSPFYRSECDQNGRVNRHDHRIAVGEKEQAPSGEPGRPAPANQSTAIKIHASKMPASVLGWAIWGVLTADLFFQSAVSPFPPKAIHASRRLSSIDYPRMAMSDHPMTRITASAPATPHRQRQSNGRQALPSAMGGVVGSKYAYRRSSAGVGMEVRCF